MKIPSFFMGKIIVTLFPFTDIPSGMKPSATKSSVLTRHPGSALNSRKVPKMPCFCGFYGVGSNEPVDEPSGFKRRGKIKLYQRRSYYARRSKLYIACSDLFYKSERAHAAAPPFQIEPAALGFDLGFFLSFAVSILCRRRHYVGVIFCIACSDLFHIHIRDRLCRCGSAAAFWARRGRRAGD